MEDYTQGQIDLISRIKSKVSELEDTTNTTDFAFDIIYLLKQVTPVARDGEPVELRLCSDCEEYGLASEGSMSGDDTFVCKSCYTFPYCPICESCGEDGCCSAVNCKHHPDGSYCAGYLEEMRFSHILVNKIFEEFDKNEEVKEKLDALYSDNWDKFHKR